MKILVIQETDWFLRGPHQQHHIFERLSGLGHKIHVIDYDFLWISKENKKFVKKIQKYKNQPKIINSSSSIEIIRPGMIQLPLFDYISIIPTHFIAIFQEIKQFKPDVIIGFGILNNFIGLILAKMYKIPFIYYLIDHLHTLLPFKPFQLLAKSLESFNIKNCDNLVAINKGLLDYSYIMGSKRKGLIISGGVDLQIYQNTSNRNMLRKKLEIVDSDIVLFFMGWIYEFSGLKEITDYIVNNENKLINIRLLIVGEGDLFDYISKKRNNLHDKGKILLTGKVDFNEIPNYLHVADICLLPAYKNKIMNNIVPIKLYEYLSVGKPVIATKLTGVYKEFGASNGIVYINNPNEVFDVLAETISNKSRIIQQGLDFISKYDWSKIIKDFERELYNIIDKVHSKY